MKKKTIAILGPKLSYTDLAYHSMGKTRKNFGAFGAFGAVKYFPTISTVFSTVASGKTEYGIVPWKNSSSGIIRESAVNFAKYKEKIKIDKRFWMKISHVLAVLPNAREQDIDTLVTKRVIFIQCRKFLKKHFPKAKKIFLKTSSAAAEFLAKSKRRRLGVIVNKEAALHYKLRILRFGLEDQPKNKTSFILFTHIS